MNSNASTPASGGTQFPPSGGHRAFADLAAPILSDPERRARVDAIKEEIMAADLGPNAVPDRIAFDAHGYGWRVWDDQEMWSMVPQNPDNEPIPEPLTWFVKEQDAERAKRQIEFLEILADGGDLTVNGVPWREMFDRLNAIVSDPV